jgi:hypothetical protein
MLLLKVLELVSDCCYCLKCSSVLVFFSLCSLVFDFLFFWFADMSSDTKSLQPFIMSSLNSNQVALNHKYREVLYTYLCLLLDLLVNQILLSLMFGCPWRMSGECDWQLVP